MIYKHRVSQLIRMRTSHRSYTKKIIHQETQRLIDEFLSNLGRGPFQSQTHFEMIGATANGLDRLKSLSTYGMIRNPRGFIVGRVKQSDNDLEDFGYLMEKIVLFLTDLGLGTCWLGGTFKKTNFTDRIAVGPGEFIPAVASIGYMAHHRTPLDTTIRLAAGSKRRKDWRALFFMNDMDTPLSKEQAGKYAEPLEMVRLGPSASNRQPWRIILKNNRIHFLLYHSKGYTRNLKMFKLNDLQRIDMGIAMCHFELTALEEGFQGAWEVNRPSDIEIQNNLIYIVSWKDQS